jgi:hypothetical protein
MSIIREGVVPGGHRYTIEHTDPEDYARSLALQLGNHINKVQVAQTNTGFYYKEAQRIEDGLPDLEKLVRKLERRDAGEPVVTTSRMDPMLTYSTSAVKEQLETLKKRVISFRERAAGFAEEARLHHEGINEVQQKLNVLNGK